LRRGDWDLRLGLVSLEFMGREFDNPQIVNHQPHILNLGCILNGGRTLVVTGDISGKRDDSTGRQHPDPGHLHTGIRPDPVLHV